MKNGDSPCCIVFLTNRLDTGLTRIFHKCRDDVDEFSFC
ncbi:hypothetical protein DAQ1742_04423 [Dickeya aquatica]|uniref:Uncharacterized protein n=1 Tax=Dickeya aquatica TaxID=1401087 RepID=A0A375AGD2_9GAMM|nr:hypothetical protein DAQ1742_04423 [Dickeya aquatica]